jgi:hypothetical protein
MPVVPAEPAAPVESASEVEGPKAGYHHGFFIEEAVNSLTIQGRVQQRFQLESVDDGSDRETETAFEIPRARLTLKGHAYTKRMSYKFQSDFGKGFVALKDFFTDYRIGGGEIRIRGGQFKKPFSRQQINSSSKLEFVDRSIVDKAFDNGRDIGLEIHNNLGKAPDLEWAVGIFNGTGDKGLFKGDVVVDPMTGEGSVEGGKFSNVPAKVRPAVAARVGYNHGGIKGYSEADLEGGPLRYAVAAAALAHFDGGTDNAFANVGADFVVKNEGLSATGGVYLKQSGADAGDLSYEGMGTYVQLGYVIDKRWQPAVRYALLAADGGDKQHEVSAAFSSYNFSHGLKWQTDVSLLSSDIGGTTTNDYRARTQLQLSF